MCGDGVGQCWVNQLWVYPGLLPLVTESLFVYGCVSQRVSVTCCLSSRVYEFQSLNLDKKIIIHFIINIAKW